MQTVKKTSYLKSTAALFCNGLRFRFARLIKTPLKPTVISLAVTNRCNSHCIMCNIWRRADELHDIQSMELIIGKTCWQVAAKTSDNRAARFVS